MHNQFEELCALAMIGQVTDSERTLLDDHTKSCEECRLLLEDLHPKVSQMAPTMAELLLVDVEPPAGMRDRFLHRAAEVGLCIHAGEVVVPDRTAEHPPEGRGTAQTLLVEWFDRIFPRRSALALSFAVAGVVLVCFVGSGAIFLRVHKKTIADASLATAIEPHATSVFPVAPPPAKPVFTANEEDRWRTELSRLSEQLAVAKAKASQLESSNQQLQRSLASASQKIQSSSTETDAQRQAAQQASAEVASLQQQLSDTKAKSVESDAIAAAQERQTLEAQTRVASLRAEMDHMYAARGIAEKMISSRNLHIVDVYDNAGNGLRDGAFGRVFFVEGKSLVFYAYDLPKSKRNKSFSFQLWGEGRGSEPTTYKLGLMKPDNAGHGGWMVSCDDPRVLNELNAVFIAPESPSTELPPTRQKLMYALLGSANHP